jgi:hypothetical protein
MKKINYLRKGFIGLLFFALLFGLFLLTTGVLSGLNRQIQINKPGSNLSSTQVPYPPPNTATPKATITQTLTRISKPTGELRPISSPTANPTALPIQSAYNVVWFEDHPNEESSILWMANPGDIGNRRELLNIKQTNVQPALSPDGKYLAFVSSNSTGAFLNLYDLETFLLQQLDQSPYLNGPVFWRIDSQDFSYYRLQKDKNSETGFSSTLEIYNVQKAAIISKIANPINSGISPIGWSTNNSFLISQPDRNSSGTSYIISEINITDGSFTPLFSTNTQMSLPALAPDGSRFLQVDQSDVKMVSSAGVLSAPLISIGPNTQILWSNQTDELLIGRLESQKPLVDISSFNITNKSEKKISRLPIPGPGNWKLIKLSPDNLWLAADLYQRGLFWIYLPNLYLVPLGVSG